MGGESGCATRRSPALGCLVGARAGSGAGSAAGESCVTFSVVALVWPIEPCSRNAETKQHSGTGELFLAGVFCSEGAQQSCPAVG